MCRANSIDPTTGKVIYGRRCPSSGGERRRAYQRARYATLKAEKASSLSPQQTPQPPAAKIPDETTAIGSVTVTRPGSTAEAAARFTALSPADIASMSPDERAALAKEAHEVAEEARERASVAQAAVMDEYAMFNFGYDSVLAQRRFFEVHSKLAESDDDRRDRRAARIGFSEATRYGQDITSYTARHRLPKETDEQWDNRLAALDALEQATRDTGAAVHAEATCYWVEELENLPDYTAMSQAQIKKEFPDLAAREPQLSRNLKNIIKEEKLVEEACQLREADAEPYNAVLAKLEDGQLEPQEFYDAFHGNTTGMDSATRLMVDYVPVMLMRNEDEAKEYLDTVAAKITNDDGQEVYVPTSAADQRAATEFLRATACGVGREYGHTWGERKKLQELAENKAYENAVSRAIGNTSPEAVFPIHDNTAPGIRKQMTQALSLFPADMQRHAHEAAPAEVRGYRSKARAHLRTDTEDVKEKARRVISYYGRGKLTDDKYTQIRTDYGEQKVGMETPEQVEDYLRDTGATQQDDGTFVGSPWSSSNRGVVFSVEHVPEAGGYVAVTRDEEDMVLGNRVIYQLRTDTSWSTTLHECAHLLDNNPAVSMAATSFVHRRTEGMSTDVWNSASEPLISDGFYNPYVSRQYKMGASEVLSMGMEGLFGERTASLRGGGTHSPVTGRDNEHRDLVLGLLGAKHS